MLTIHACMTSRVVDRLVGSNNPVLEGWVRQPQAELMRACVRACFMHFRSFMHAACMKDLENRKGNWYVVNPDFRLEIVRRMVTLKIC